MNNNSTIFGNVSLSTKKLCFSVVSYDEHVASTVATTAMNGIFSPVAVILNSIIAVLICRTPSLRDHPGNILIAGLSLADILTGMVTQPLFVIGKVLWLKCNPFWLQINHGVLASMMLCSGGAFLIIACLSLEKVLALHYHLRYNSIVTTNRTWIFIGSTWLFTFLCSLLFAVVDYRILNIVSSFIGSACIIITLVAHVKIFATVRRHRRQISAQVLSIRSADPNIQFEMTRWQATLQETKRAINLAYFVGLYFIFFSPQMVLQLHKFVKHIQANSLTNYFNWTETLLFIRASFNPIVWFVRKRELRNVFKNALGAG